MIVLQGAILTLLIFAVGAVGLYSITRMAGADKTLYTEGVEILGRVGTMGEAAASMRSTMRDLLLATDQAVNQRFKKNYDGDKDRLHLTIRELADLSKGDPDVKAVVDEVSSTMDKYFVFADDVARLAMENKNTESYTYMKTTALPANNAFREALAKMRAVVHDTAEGRMRQNEKTAKTSAITLALCLAAAAALAAAATATAALAAARR
jgi:CHASE3 domain sensor protein